MRPTSRPIVALPLASLLVAALAHAGPEPRGPVPHGTGADLVFQIPYQGAATPTSQVLQAATSIQSLDVYLLLDWTGSMAAELAALRSNLAAVLGELTCPPSGSCATDGDCPPGEACVDGTCVNVSGPACAASVHSGVGRFDECGTYRNLVSIQSNPSTTQNAVPSAPGGGSAEAPFQALARLADPSTPAYGTNPAACSPTGIACPGFRADALRVLIHVTDADNQAGASCSAVILNMAAAELLARGIRYGAVVGNGDDSGAPGTPLSMARSIGAQSGSVDGSGAPFAVFAVDAAVPNAVRDVVRAMITQMPGDVTVEVLDDTTDAVDARQFVDYVETHAPGGACTAGHATEDRAWSDGRPDTYLGVLPGTPLCWRIVPATNTAVPSGGSSQSYPATLVVRALGSVVHTARVVFVVPATVSVPPAEPGAAFLGPARPNPSTGMVSFEYGAPLPGPAPELEVFDSRGRRVRRLDLPAAAGRGVATWDGRDATGARVGPGLYLLRLKTGDLTVTRKVSIAD